MDSSIYDNLKSLMAVIRDERTPLANTANRVGTALMAIVDALGLLDSEKQDGATDAFLSKKNDDTAAGVISFLQSISVAGRALLNGGIQLGDALLLYDSENNAVKVCGRNGTMMNFYATGGVSAYGFSGSDEGGSSSVDVELILQSGVPIATVAGVTIYAPEASSGGGGASTWDELSGKPSWLTATAPAVSTFGNDVGYVMSSELGALASLSTVGTKQITNYAVTNDKIADGAVKETKIADASVSTSKLVDLAVTTAKLADASIIAQKIADAAVTNAKLQHSSMRLWGADVALGASYDGNIYLGKNSGLRLTDGTHTAWLKYDSANNAVYVADEYDNAVNLYSTGSVSAFGFSESSGGGGSVDVEQILSSGVHIATIAGVNIYAPEGGASAWADITGKPSWLTDDKPKVSAFANDAGYITAAGQLWQDNGGTYQITGVNTLRFDDADVYMSGVVEIQGSLDVTGGTSVTGNATFNGESTFKRTVFLPGQYTFFGQDGIYVEADRTENNVAAYIGVHRSFAGVGATAAFNLDGRIQVLRPMAVRSDPEDDISLRVGGTLKTDFLTAGGATRPESFWFASPNGCFGNPSTGRYTQFNEGGDIELSHPTPFIDFHYGCSTADFTSRLIAAEDGVLQIQSATTDPALRIGNAYLRYDLANNALYVTGADGEQVNFYATGNVAGYSGLDGSVSELTNLDITGQLTAARVNVDIIESAGTLQLNSGSGCDIVLNGNATVDPGGWIVAPWLAANQRLHVEQGGKLSIGSTAADHGITDVYADGTYVYITINGMRYRFTPSSKTAV